MAFISSNPVMDAQDHFSQLIDLEPENSCNACEEGFYSDMGGMQTPGGEKFCKCCLADYRHFDFYRQSCGLTDSEIYNETSQLQPL